MANQNTRGPVKSRILLVDDHPVFRRGVADIINEEQKLEVCGEASNMQDAFDLVGKLKPNLAIIDVSLDGNN